MKKRVFGIILALVLTASLLPVATGARAGYTPAPVSSHYFYDQLGVRAKAIYDKLLSEFTGSGKADYYAGTKSIDLMGLKSPSGAVLVTGADVDAYVAGDKALFNDFSAAKDALDLDHSELWYIDSGYLSFRVARGGDGYHVLVGPGRGPTYLLGGQTIEDVAEKDAEVRAAIDAICDNAVKSLNEAMKQGSYSEADKAAALVSSVHDQVTAGIHYRYEIECHDPANAKYIRTLYGMVTHEGVCEAYARTVQVCLTQLGVECVLVHGLQTKGTPEDHMWNEVKIGQGWYAVDATWDDPLVADYTGKRDLTFKYGLDGRETNTYLMVGQMTVGEHWIPSGYVSTGNFEFTYPAIETTSYSGAVAFSDHDGLQVHYSAGGTMEGVPAGVFSVTYQGMDAAQARAKGLYFIIRMYDYHPDGTADVMDEWYYADATFLLSHNNPYFGDYGGALRIYTPTCEYVEVGVTTREPDHRDQWTGNASTSYLTKHPDAGYFHGDESEIIAQTGMMYNVNSKYEAPPYVLTQTPAPNGNATAGYEYRVVVTYDDDLSHPLAATASTPDAVKAAGTPVRVHYTTIQQDLHTGGDKYVSIAGKLPFDTDRDGVVDMTGSYTDFKWIYKYAGTPDLCPNREKHKDGVCDVSSGCAITGVEFNFRASDQWIDDVTEYNFSIEGVVGSRSNKAPNHFSFICVVPGLCPACYRSQGIDWNLWGQPTLLDAPENLDLLGMARSGGTDSATLSALSAQMNTNDINGRLMLVVEDKSKGSGNREEYEKINGLMETKTGYNDKNVLASSVFEINFNRLCPMVKLKPNAGQSLRVQVGYPAGVTYEDIGKDVELKAYHFTRCDANNRCEYYTDKNHKDGEHIVSVEEITIVPTPYGMVIMCDAFSPFEIVAVKKSGAASASGSGTVVVVSSEGGVVSVDGHDAVGTSGNVKFASAAVAKTFTVKPDAGYVVDTVSLGGTNISVTDNTFTVSGVTKNDVLNVTFVPESVRESDAVSGLTAVAAGACAHAHTKKDTSGPAEKAPTCTEPGYARAIICTDCGQTVTPAHEIPAAGHKEVVSTPEVPATCTKDGKAAVSVCSVCKATVSGGEVIPATGHTFSHYKSGTPTCQGLTKTATCVKCGVKETVSVPGGAVDHKFTKFTVVTPATCYSNAIEEASCDYGCGVTVRREKEGSAVAHKIGKDGLCTVCGAYPCSAGHKLIETAAVAATCVKDGHTSGIKCSVCGYWAVPEELVPATGHTFADTASGSKCLVCGVARCEKHKEAPVPTVAATCETEGLTGGKRCSVCGDILEKPTVVPALGHDWDVDSAKWHWSTNGEPSACVTLTCKREAKTRCVVATLTELSGKDPVRSTCSKAGSALYTAVVALGSGEPLTATRTVALPIDPTAHAAIVDALEITEATCARHATRTYECAECGENIFEIVEGELPAHKMALEHIAPTCTEAGYSANICTECGVEEKIVGSDVPAIGHRYENGKCVHCGLAEPKPVTFLDVPAGEWYESAVSYVVAHGLMDGVGNNRFAPKNDTTRAQLVTILYRLEGEPTAPAGKFTDVPAGQWYSKAVSWAAANGIVDGYNDGTFKPMQALTREQMAKILYGYAKYKGLDMTVTTGIDGYSDASSVHNWAVIPISWAISKGLIGGVGAAGGVTLSPYGSSVRAQTATVLMRLCENVLK